MGEIRIRKGRAKPLWRGHPWVFADSVESVEGFPGPGELVTVRAPDVTLQERHHPRLVVLERLVLRLVESGSCSLPPFVRCEEICCNE